MTGVTAVGTWPGSDQLTAQLEVFEDLITAPFGVTAVPFWVVPNDSGPHGGLFGRTLSLLDQMPVEVGPHGWKLADRPGGDVRSLVRGLNQNVETLSIAAAGYQGPLSLSVVGPWTLAASLYTARGDRVLADRGAVRALTDSLGAGVDALIARIRSALPGVTELSVQVDEHLIGQVAAGVLPTFSGYSRIPRVPGPELVEHSRGFYSLITQSGARSVVRVGDAWVGIAPSVVSGATAVCLDLGAGLGRNEQGWNGSNWNEQGWEHLARAAEKGVELWFGLPAPEISSCAGPNLLALAQAITVPWRRIGLESHRLAAVTISPSGSALRNSFGATATARGTIATLKKVAEHLAEKASE